MGSATFREWDFSDRSPLLAPEPLSRALLPNHFPESSRALVYSSSHDLCARVVSLLECSSSHDLGARCSASHVLGLGLSLGANAASPGSLVFFVSCDLGLDLGACVALVGSPLRCS